MISVVATIKVVKNNMFIFVIQLITIHLGRNPTKGGIPPRDKKFNSKQNLVCLSWFITLLIWFM